MDEVPSIFSTKACVRAFQPLIRCAPHFGMWWQAQSVPAEFARGPSEPPVSKAQGLVLDGAEGMPQLEFLALSGGASSNRLELPATLLGWMLSEDLIFIQAVSTASDKHQPVQSNKSTDSKEPVSRSRQDRSQDSNDWQVGGLTTGFPVPLYYSVPERIAHRDARGKIRASDQDTATSSNDTSAGSKQAHDLRPVFRAAPYRAERERSAESRTTTRLLIVDEGNLCRSVLAEAMFKRLLASSKVPLDVTAESASIGPAADGPHDARVMAVAQEAGLSLSPRPPRIFDELQDIVNYDLVLVMDKFDLEAVLREVAVFDTINPGGHYAERVRLLGSYAVPGRARPLRPAPSSQDPDISDPLWGNLGGEDDTAALWGLLRQLRLASKGLLTHLIELNSRYPGRLQLGISEAVRLVAHERSSVVAQRLQQAPAAKRWQPIWREATTTQDEGNLYTIRVTNGNRHVVRRPKYTVKRGYWRDVENVEAEVRRWIGRHGSPGQMPTGRELRQTGHSSLETAVRLHGGQQTIASRMQLSTQRRHNGFWSQRGNLQKELLEFVEDGPPPDVPAAAGSNGSGMQEGAGDPHRVMPSLSELRAAGRGDLMGAVQMWGGTEAVADLMGLSLTYQARRRKRADLAEVYEVVQRLAPDVLAAGFFPTRLQLLASGPHQPLVDDIRVLGGFRRVAASLGLHYANAGSIRARLTTVLQPFRQCASITAAR
ncbi:hypothetical protein WJX73_009718 [Symbiochloris irregularis]|uniref:Phosphotyrosine protein phosphatase I domain-containing protein n=1 Tax=Symbiochloris irregularis TaxID=706552 RepID=A0AAW1NUR1_9CHLO